MSFDNNLTMENFQTEFDNAPWFSRPNFVYKNFNLLPQEFVVKKNLVGCYCMKSIDSSDRKLPQELHGQFAQVTFTFHPTVEKQIIVSACGKFTIECQLTATSTFNGDMFSPVSLIVGLCTFKLLDPEWKITGEWPYQGLRYELKNGVCNDEERQAWLNHVVLLFPNREMLIDENDSKFIRFNTHLYLKQ